MRWHYMAFLFAQKCCVVSSVFFLPGYDNEISCPARSRNNFEATTEPGEERNKWTWPTLQLINFGGVDCKKGFSACSIWCGIWHWQNISKNASPRNEMVFQLPRDNQEAISIRLCSSQSSRKEGTGVDWRLLIRPFLVVLVWWVFWNSSWQDFDNRPRGFVTATRPGGRKKESEDCI